MLSHVLIYCKRSLDFGMKETLKKRIVDINIYIENLLLLSPHLRQRETEKMDETRKPATALGRQTNQKNEWANKR